MKKLITLVVLAAFSVLTYAGDPARKGTTGAEQLLVPVGAQAIATGGAMHAKLQGLESIYYNPAGLDLTKQTEALFSYMNYLADIKVSYFAAGASIEGFGSVALSLKSFDVGDIPVTTMEFPDGTGSTYSPGFMTFGLTYSRVLTDRVSIGVNAKFINETIENATANGFGLDFGVQYRFDSKLALAASVKNIGSNMKYTGGKIQRYAYQNSSIPGASSQMLEAVTEEFQIPSFFELSLAYEREIAQDNSITLGTTVTVNNAMEDILNFGAEYGFMKTFFLRAGYRSMMENNSSSIYGYSLGAGVTSEIMEGMRATFDYAYQDVKEFPTANHVFTVKFSMK